MQTVARICYWTFTPRADDQWQRYQTITNRIADEDIDPYLVFRLLTPLYSNYHQVAVHQRDLTTYDESVVLDGAVF